MNLRKIRKQLGLNQHDFYSRISVTQSGGSRYESGRTPPKPVQDLISLAYGTEKERARVAKRLGIAL